MTEQESTDKLEQLVGSPDGCFRLMRLYRACEQSVSGNKYEFSMRKKRSLEDTFRDRANADGYSNAAIEHYLANIR